MLLPPGKEYVYHRTAGRGTTVILEEFLHTCTNITIPRVDLVIDIVIINL